MGELLGPIDKNIWPGLKGADALLQTRVLADVLLRAMDHMIEQNIVSSDQVADAVQLGAKGVRSSEFYQPSRHSAPTTISVGDVTSQIVGQVRNFRGGINA